MNALTYWSGVSSDSYVGVKVVFRVPSPCCVGVDEQKQDALERLALGVHPKVEAGVRASCDGHHPFTHDEVVRELLATAVRAERLVGQSLASNDLVFKLDVFQLVRACLGQSRLPLGRLRLGSVRRPSRCKGPAGRRLRGR